VPEPGFYLADQGVFGIGRAVQHGSGAVGYQFGRGAWRRRAQVGGVVAQAPVDFMPNGADYRYGRFRHCPHYSFVGKGQQVFEGSAAPAYDYHVAEFKGIGRF